ncbi:hypothetical protein BSP10_117 [Bacillus phage BSP10]|uniref:Uncharacterized protein n=1 Tax=Bacillus phage Grass TaxID=1406785 RepID=U5PYC9_BPGRA|nr:hypothetical protein Grass_213 [Bacillus phage Grass]AGY47478.1 hypothetical protein Grass_213 [Bacillus phage Grass]AUO79520.1 hypothetical protein BSP10_117 [Bacillus phage BSP10]QRI44648.1 hypothetical protein BSTP3_102 [Bacillus phage BSTP3]
MTIESYIVKRSTRDMTMEEIQEEYSLSEGTVYTLELGYQCYLKSIPLDRAIKVIKRY